jgi:hypothetical protein
MSNRTNWWADFVNQQNVNANAASWTNAQGQTCRVVCSSGPEQPQLPPLVGMRLDFARLIYPNIRIVEQDGNPLPTTMDYQPDRLNVAVSNGIISRVVNFG